MAAPKRIIRWPETGLLPNGSCLDGPAALAVAGLAEFPNKPTNLSNPHLSRPQRREQTLNPWSEAVSDSRCRSRTDLSIGAFWHGFALVDARAHPAILAAVPRRRTSRSQRCARRSCRRPTPYTVESLGCWIEVRVERAEVSFRQLKLAWLPRADVARELHISPM